MLIGDLCNNPVGQLYHLWPAAGVLVPMTPSRIHCEGLDDRTKTSWSGNDAASRVVILGRRGGPLQL